MKLGMRAGVAVLVAFGLGCTPEAPAPLGPEPVEPAPLGVVEVTNEPMAWAVERLAGPLVELRFRAAGAADPAYWKPTTEDVLAMQEADLIVLNGASYEGWLKDVSLPPSRLVDTTAAVRDRLIAVAETVTHSHGPEGEHEHGGFAFTTWLDPGLAIDQVRAIEAAIALRRPEHEAEISRRAADLEDDLVDLDSRLAAAAKTLDREPLLFSHPVYQYLIRRYDLNAIELHWEPDQAPDQSAWDHLDEVLEGHRARWMLWESAPLDVTVRGLDQRDVAALVFNPCGNRPAEGDYLTAMGENAASLETVAR